MNYSAQGLKNVTVPFPKTVFQQRSAGYKLRQRLVQNKQTMIACMYLIIPKYKNKEEKCNSDDPGNAIQVNYED